MTNKAESTALMYWAPDFEADTRRRLSAIEAHQIRSDSLLLDIQLEARRNAKEQRARDAAISEKLSQLIALLTSLVGATRP